MKTLTPTQKALLEICTHHCYGPTKWLTLKSMSNVASFDSSFNALLKQGYFEHYPTANYENRFVRTKKQYKKG